MRKLLNLVAGTLLAFTLAGAGLADADGPDFYRVTGVSADDVLNIRAKPTASGDKVGSIPHDGNGIRNLGCEGGLSYAEWAEASEEERAASVRRRWCWISYDGVEGWVAGRFLAEGSAPRDASGPSFDCDKASGSAEEEICSNPRLARLDRELARLYKLAVNGANMSSERLSELKAMQRGWIKGRDECWKSDAALNACIAASYAMRIDDIRTRYYDSRQDDAAGISSGPNVYECDGLGAALSMIIVDIDPPLLSLRWFDNWITPVGVPTGSGAKFAAQTSDGNYEFWSKENEAIFTLANGKVLDCTLGETG